MLKEIVEMYQVQSGDPGLSQPSAEHVLRGSGHHVTSSSGHPRRSRRSQRTDDLEAEGLASAGAAWPAFAQAAGKLCHLSCFVCSLLSAVWRNAVHERLVAPEWALSPLRTL